MTEPPAAAPPPEPSPTPLEPDPAEIRVVACLVEKQRTTPDVYPLSLNALRLACNQSTNRDPVVAYDEATVSEALRRLALRGWTRLASGAGSRARKYRHLLPEALGVAEDELSLLAVLMLRGEQTPGELKQRSERLYGFESLAATQGTLNRLVERGYVARHPRRPGQKEERYTQLFGDARVPRPSSVAPDGPEGGPTPRDKPALASQGGELAVADGDADQAGASATAQPQTGARASAAAPPPAAPEIVPAEDRLTRLEREVATLRGELARLREALGEP